MSKILHQQDFRSGELQYWSTAGFCRTVEWCVVQFSMKSAVLQDSSTVQYYLSLAKWFINSIVLFITQGCATGLLCAFDVCSVQGKGEIVKSFAWSFMCHSAKKKKKVLNSVGICKQPRKAWKISEICKECLLASNANSIGRYLTNQGTKNNFPLIG